MTRRWALRFAYATALVIYTAYVVWFLFVLFPEWTTATGMPRAIRDDQSFKTMFYVAGLGGYLQLALPLAILVVRPMFWGKLLMLLFIGSGVMTAMVGWMMSLVDPVFARAISPAYWTAGSLVLVAIIQQVIDPTWWRPLTSWGSGDYPPPRDRNAKL